jgi:hypothetical protein
VGALNLLICSLSGFASDLTEPLQFSGFANFGLTHASGDQLGFRTQLINEGRNGFSFSPDSLLGLQVNGVVDEKFDFVVQAVLQDRIDSSLSNFLEMAFLRYQINRNWQVKAGRFSTNSYLFTDFRYVSQATYWVRPPVEMYATVGSLGNMDGIKLAYTHDTDFGFARVSGAFGNSRLSNDGDDGMFRIAYNDLLVLNLELQSDNWRLQGAYLNAQLEDFQFDGKEQVLNAPLTAPPMIAPLFQMVSDAFIPDGEHVSYFSLGGKYFFEQLEIAAEFGNYDSKWALSGSAKFGYVSAAYTKGALMPFVTLAFSDRKQAPEIIDIEGLSQALPPALLQFLAVSVKPINDAAIGVSVDQSSGSFGVRWDISDDWVVKAQFDHFRISEQGSGLFSVVDGGVTNENKTSYNVTSIGIATTF